MGHGNVAEFILLGLFTVENAEVACFVLFLLCYIAILRKSAHSSHHRSRRLSEQPMYFFSALCPWWGSAPPPWWHPNWPLTCWPSRRPSPTTAAWPRCFMPTSLEPLRSSSWWPWPMTAMLPSADLFTTWSPWTDRCAMSLWWLWEPSAIQSCKYYHWTSLPWPTQIGHYFWDVFPWLKLACTGTRLRVTAIITTTGVLSIATLVPWWFLTSSSCPPWGLAHPRPPPSPLHLWSTHHCGLQVLLVSHLHLCPRG